MSRTAANNGGPRRKDSDPASQGPGDARLHALRARCGPAWYRYPRMGLRFECIGCAACIDACDSVNGKDASERACALHFRIAHWGCTTRWLHRAWLLGRRCGTLMIGCLPSPDRARPLDVVLGRERAKEPHSVP